MARHRNVRNLKRSDYDEEDFDIYGQSYDDNYGVSPGTVENYMYSRSSGKNFELSSYIPSENPVEEEQDVVESNSKFVNNENLPSNPSNKSKVQNTSSNYKTLCVTKIQNALGEYYPMATIQNAALKFDYNAERAINYLITSEKSSATSRDTKLNKSSNVETAKHSTTSNSNAMPQRSQRGRRSQLTEKNATNVKEDKYSRSTINISTTSASPIVKIGTNSATPVKTGFHLSTNNADGLGSSAANDQQKLNGFTTSRLKNGVSSVSREESNEVVPSTPVKLNKSLIDYQKEYNSRSKCAKQQISMVVIGHVDAGKSTMMGHLLFRKGIVSKRVIHKYKQDSQKAGKSSFAFAWVLDETGEERERGVTMDIANNYFETENRMVTLMDAPGHRDFIPNMITGASQADVAMLVVGSSTGEFEAGFGDGGQTREHALLVRSLGVSQLAVAVNKLDTVNWSQERFDEIVSKLKYFLKQAGFRDSDVTYVPVSGLLGENLTEKSQNSLLCSWYSGPSLSQVIDRFRPPQRPVDYPFRFCVNDVFRGQGSGIYISGKIESGGVCPNTKVIVMPAGEKGLIKAVESGDDKGRLDFALAGEHATLILNGVEMNKINKGSVVCDFNQPIKAVTRLQARVIIFNNIEVPITRGFPVELHYKAVSEPAMFRKLISLLHKSTGEVISKKPRILKKGQNALVEIETARAVCLEEYSNLKELGRCTLRYGGSTIAACVVTQLLG